MYCPHCGKKIDDDSKFCTFCGKNTNDDDILTYDYTSGSEKGTSNVSKHLFWWGLLYFLIFPTGIVAFFKYKGKNSKRSKLGLIMAWIAIIVIVLGCVSYFIADTIIHR